MVQTIWKLPEGANNVFSGHRNFRMVQIRVIDPRGNFQMVQTREIYPHGNF